MSSRTSGPPYRFATTLRMAATLADPVTGVDPRPGLEDVGLRAEAQRKMELERYLKSQGVPHTILPARHLHGQHRPDLLSREAWQGSRLRGRRREDALRR